MLEPAQDLGSLNFGSAMSACKGKSLFYECTSKAQTDYGAGLESALKQPQILLLETVQT